MLNDLIAGPKCIPGMIVKEWGALTYFVEDHNDIIC